MQISPFSFKKAEDLSLSKITTHIVVLQVYKPLFSEVDNNNLSGQESFYNGPLASSFKKNHFFGKKVAEYSSNTTKKLMLGYK